MNRKKKTSEDSIGSTTKDRYRNRLAFEKNPHLLQRPDIDQTYMTACEVLAGSGD